MLTLLWVLVILSFAFDWQYHRAAFVVDNNSPFDIANALNGPNVKSLGILDNFFSMCCNLLADALLVSGDGKPLYPQILTGPIRSGAAICFGKTNDGY